MKLTQKDSVNAVAMSGSSQPTSRGIPKLLIWLVLFFSLSYIFYIVKLLSDSPRACKPTAASYRRLSSNGTEEIPGHLVVSDQTATLRKNSRKRREIRRATELKHVVFGIAASAKYWQHRKEYIKLWFKPKQMRGIVWLDEEVNTTQSESLPPIRISSDTSKFPYSNKIGHRSAIRISRIVSETLRLGVRNVRWFVMGDDDTIFMTENLLRVLRKYDHNQYYYIGSFSESHLQNVFFSFGMAYGGGGFAISYPLAKALDKMQDRCIMRYPGLYGSDDRMQACMAELGVPLSKELGFHQYDVYGNTLGLLAAHPVAPFLSMHHLDLVDPIFPKMRRVQAIQHLMLPMKLDSASLMQLSICYDKERDWTITVSWGFVVQIFRGYLPAREMEMPARTFLNWYKRTDYSLYSFNTRPIARNQCQHPFVFYMQKAAISSKWNQTVTEYARHRVQLPPCDWKVEDPAYLRKVFVYKKQDPHLWDRSPRRNCCRVINLKKKGKIGIDVGLCKAGEISY